MATSANSIDVDEAELTAMKNMSWEELITHIEARWYLDSSMLKLVVDKWYSVSKTNRRYKNG